MDRQWVLSSAEKLLQFLTRSSRAVFSSFMQESAVRPIIRPTAPAALQLGSTLRVGTSATVIRLEPSTRAAKGIMAGTSIGRACGGGIGRRASRNNNTDRGCWVSVSPARAGLLYIPRGPQSAPTPARSAAVSSGLVVIGKWFDAILRADQPGVRLAQSWYSTKWCVGLSEAST